FSVLGNHDYGDYLQWPSAEAKAKNLNDLIAIHKKMGWDILINENRILEKNGEKIAVIGIENWGARGNFPKYGKLNKAYKGTENIPVKLLLSHDPSHWRAQVLTEYKDIDVMFAGHTHGFQFGIENRFFKWSPVKYFYDEWAGLYSEKNQHLYVNRGFGFIGFPGRVGILPEITIMQLKQV
ncbi:MAG: metallophosphoesterase, partial [Cytophagaceae bacterium]|nr:metallophosphoesterase [Cytophagaceae bacterium]